MCYGLTLPLTDHDTIRDCVGIYCDWMMCLTEAGRVCIPAPVLEEPNVYVQDMFHHLYNIFVPRSESCMLNYKLEGEGRGKRKRDIVCS